MQIVSLVGLGLLCLLLGFPFIFFGNKLFWFFTACIGLVTGALVVAPLVMWLAEWYYGVFGHQGERWQLYYGARTAGAYIPVVIASSVVVAGGFGVLAYFWRRPMTMITAFLAGGTFLMLLGAVAAGGVMFWQVLFAVALSALGGPYWQELAPFQVVAILFPIGAIASAALAWKSPVWARILVSALFGILVTGFCLIFVMYVTLYSWGDSGALARYGNPLLYNIGVIGVSCIYAGLGIYFQWRRLAKPGAPPPGNAVKDPLAAYRLEQP